MSELVTDFGTRGMCAALNMTELEFFRERREGRVAPPDSARTNDARWTVLALGAEIKKRVPAGVEPVTYSLAALKRAEDAEGWLDVRKGGGDVE